MKVLVAVLAALAAAAASFAVTRAVADDGAEGGSEVVLDEGTGVTTFLCPGADPAGERRGGDRVWVVGADESGAWVVVRDPVHGQVWLAAEAVAPDLPLDELDLPRVPCRADASRFEDLTGDEVVIPTTSTVPPPPTTVPSDSTTVPPTTRPPDGSSTTVPPTTLPPTVPAELALGPLTATPSEIFEAGCSPSSAEVSGQLSGSGTPAGVTARRRWTDPGFDDGWAQVPVRVDGDRVVADVEDLDGPWSPIISGPFSPAELEVEVSIDTAAGTRTRATTLTVRWCP